MEQKTNPKEFEKFYDCLMQNAPTDYIPWFFPVVANDKNPDTLATFKQSKNKSSCCNADWIKVQRGEKKVWICSNCGKGRSSWKQSHARLNKKECLERLRLGGNIGFSARKDDPVVLIDLDSDSVPDLTKETLSLQSRSRVGRHRIGFAGDEKIKCNITTESFGEVRSLDEYIVSPGSFVPLSQEAINALPEKEKPLAGCYTVEKEVPPATLFWEDLPQCFKDAVEKIKRFSCTETNKNIFIQGTGKRSALFELKMSDIVANYSPRFPHPLHSSETGANFSVSDNGQIAHCWRHLVSLNALQFLAVKSGRFDCSQIGNKHKGARKTLPNEAIFWAWWQAKTDGLIPLNDPIPVKAIQWIAEKHEIWKKSIFSPIMPKTAFKKCLKIVEKEY